MHIGNAIIIPLKGLQAGEREKLLRERVALAKRLLSEGGMNFM